MPSSQRIVQRAKDLRYQIDPSTAASPTSSHRATPQNGHGVLGWKDSAYSSSGGGVLSLLFSGTISTTDANHNDDDDHNHHDEHKGEEEGKPSLATLCQTVSHAARLASSSSSSPTDDALAYSLLVLGNGQARSADHWRRREEETEGGLRRGCRCIEKGDGGRSAGEYEGGDTGLDGETPAGHDRFDVFRGGPRTVRGTGIADPQRPFERNPIDDTTELEQEPKGVDTASETGRRSRLRPARKRKRRRRCGRKEDRRRSGGEFLPGWG